MAYIVTAVTLDNPSTDPAITEGQTFSMDGTVTGSGNHAFDYDAHYQWDQGTGTWTDITSSTSNGLSTSTTNPQTNLTGTAIPTATIQGNVAGTYNVRLRTVDHNDGDSEDLSSSQQVTVSAASTDETTLFDGLAVIKDTAAPLFDGQAVVKDTAAPLFDGYADILYTSSAVNFSDDVTTNWDESTDTTHYTEVELIATGSDSTYVRATTASVVDEFEVAAPPTDISTCKHVDVDVRGIITDAGSTAVIAVSLWVSSVQQGSTLYISGTDFAAYGTRGTAPTIRFENVNLTQAQCNALQIRWQALTAEP